MSFAALILSITFVIFSHPKHTNGDNSCPDIIPNTDQDQIECWEKVIEKTIDNQGLDKAFEKLAELYAKEPVFANNCHSFTHIIGQKAYEKFRNNETINLPPQTAFCGYGFYHGFMEELLAKGGDVKEARKFCQMAEAQLSSKIQNSGLACFHGIGHGNVDIHDERKWGNEDALIEPALKLCDQIAITEHEMFRCSSGVFNSISILESSNQYGLSINKKDPIGICKKQPDRYKEGCYSDMMVILPSLTKNNFPQEAKFVEQINEDKYAQVAIRTLSSLNARDRINNKNYDQPILDCRNLQNRLQEPCITGFADGLIEFGEPAKEYIKAITFCNTPILSSNEKGSCLEDVTRYSFSIYEPEKALLVCKQVWGQNSDKCSK